MSKNTHEPYIPELGIEYPANPDEHMGPVRYEVELVLNEQYPFLDRSLGFRIKSALLYFGIFTLVFVIAPIRFGLKIEGRRYLKQYRSLLRNGAMTVSNHMLRWDLLCVLQAIRFRRLYFPAWKENLSGPDRGVIRLAGGIPVPTDIHSMKHFNQAFEDLHARKKWIHVFPESSNWFYYQPIRPFKKGMFTLAYKFNIPVIPLAFSYRKPTGLYRLFKKNYPLITLRMGAPLLPDITLPRKEAVNLLREECHRKIVELAGITNNPYPAEGD
ncbi:MAG: 1-acyl-sn-glycerol-3-phosphate acyltransferase [Treponema sp.]|jgi:1-acyl-sn-glycerol-3-phosphate acyltransferase|nr:1-acyl-sn-glycerol-3-phosphate acyltransferase [Treponema sp.]